MCGRVRVGLGDKTITICIAIEMLSISIKNVFDRTFRYCLVFLVVRNRNKKSPSRERETHATVTHRGPMTVGRTYDRRGCLKKVGQIRVRLDAAPDAGQGGCARLTYGRRGGGGGRDARDRNNLGCIWETV